jgi:hypothetical protein
MMQELVTAKVMNFPLEEAKLWIGKPVTEGTEGPQIGEVVAAEAKDNWTEITMKIYDARIIDKWLGGSLMSVSVGVDGAK